MSAALLMLDALALLAIWCSDLMAMLALLTSAMAVLAAVFSLHRYRRQRGREIVIPLGQASVLVDGVPVQDFRVAWRGPIATLVWQAADGSRQRLLFWPDTLLPAQRRELRLAAHARGISSRRG